jgi:hypothetical protein
LTNKSVVAAGGVGETSTLTKEVVEAASGVT